MYKQAEQLMRDKPVSSPSHWPLLQYLPWVPAPTSFNKEQWHMEAKDGINPFLSFPICFFFCFLTQRPVSPCRPSSPRTPSVNKADLKLRNLPASTSHMWEYTLCTVYFVLGSGLGWVELQLRVLCMMEKDSITELDLQSSCESYWEKQNEVT